MSKFIDITGQKIGRLTVLYRTEDKLYGKNNRKTVMWHCVCECGNEIDVASQSLKRGLTKSCGCLNLETIKRRDIKHKIHGENKSRLYECWHAMKKRCLNKHSAKYINYGGRGITICEEWKNDYVSFSVWAKQNGYNDSLTLDRIDVNGNYCPENCRWADRKTQQRNKRNNRNITFNGETHTLIEWSEITGINQSTISGRLDKYGWSVEKALTVKANRRF